MALTRVSYDMIAATTAVVSNKTVGSIVPGQTITNGTTLQEFIELMVTATFAPTYVAPSVDLLSSISSPQEAGYSANLTLTANFNRGSIDGLRNDPTEGIWNAAGFQAYRAGAATKYTIDDVDRGTNNSKNNGTVTVAAGNNTFSSTVDYAIGEVPLNSKGLALDVNGDPLTALATGSVSASVTVVGQRKYFYGVDHASANSADVRGLANGVLNPSNGTTFTINIPLGATSVVFAYPATLRDVTTVKYVEGLNAEVKGIFTKTPVNVEGANAYEAIEYKVYRYVPNAPFPNAATYNVTI